ncbi:uncharacterized protein CDAR_10291 [Caerostris darwini]|uniref:Uncharacterized protein n=1 Tax=Caerostris darwini TaxID=1538125 RepID=A0AAV4VK64_9ARAC|nr:uncharacterized protein CDAR_10291 [Caerostris darwini]
MLSILYQTPEKRVFRHTWSKPNNFHFGLQRDGQLARSLVIECLAQRRLPGFQVEPALCSMLSHHVCSDSETLKRPWSDLLLFGYGGLFESGDEDLELAFRYAVDHVNADTNVLPMSRLQAHVERVEKHDSFTASKKDLVTGLPLLQNAPWSVVAVRRRNQS